MVSPVMGLICERARSHLPGRSRGEAGTSCGFCSGDGGHEGAGQQVGGGFAVGFEGLVGFGVSDAARGGLGLDVGVSQGRRRRKAEGGVSLARDEVCSGSFSAGRFQVSAFDSK